MTQKKGGHAVPLKPAQMNEEQLMEAKFRSLSQRVDSIGQGVLFNLAGNPAIVNDGKVDAEALAQTASKTAVAFIKEMGAALNAIREEIFKEGAGDE